MYHRHHGFRQPRFRPYRYYIPVKWKPIDSSSEEHSASPEANSIEIALTISYACIFLNYFSEYAGTKQL